jgi:hypothetical protein
MIRLGSDRIMERNVLKKKKVYQIFCPPKGGFRCRVLKYFQTRNEKK